MLRILFIAMVNSHKFGFLFFVFLAVNSAVVLAQIFLSF